MRITNPFSHESRKTKSRPCGVDTEIWRLMSAEYERHVRELHENLEAMR